jgi:hypothetical protein
MLKAKDALAGVLIAIPFIVYFAIPSYNIVNPEWGGVPFFWWWQAVWLAISAALFFPAALMLGRKS